MRREHHIVNSDASQRICVLDDSKLYVFGIMVFSCGIEPPHDYNFSRNAVLLQIHPMENKYKEENAFVEPIDGNS
jgi:hypothetical protein